MACAPSSPDAIRQGVLLAALALELMVSGVTDIRTSFSFFPEPKESNELRSEGVYALMRHPQYSGTVAFVVGKERKKEKRKKEKKLNQTLE